jgi:predicted DNA-binding transcriptional regulator AlpA
MRTLNSTDLAELFCLSPLSIHSTLVRRPDRLPPPIRVPGSSRLLWLESDVLAWLESHKSKAESAPRKRGRPFKQPKLNGKLDSLEQLDLMRAAIHECSHAAVVRHFGGLAMPRVFRNVDRSSEDMHWGGNCDYQFSGKLSNKKLRMIGIAGIIGEILFIDREQDEIGALVTTIDTLSAGYTVSESDRAISKGVTEGEIITAIRLIKNLRADIEREASCMVKYETCEE